MVQKTFKKIVGMAVAAGLLAGVLSATQPVQEAEAATTTQTQVQKYKQQMFSGTNVFLKQQGKSNLGASKHLDKVAQNWANHMAKNKDYRHNPNFATQIWATPGWVGSVAENIAAGQNDGTAAVKSWVNSAGHRKNILSDVNRVGLGVAKDRAGKFYYVQVLGKTDGSDVASSIYSPPKNGTTPPKPNTGTPFIDVTKKTPHYSGIMWMWDNGITTGNKTSKGNEFRPNQITNKEQMAAFLYRLYGDKSYKAPAKSPFVDVKPGQAFYKEIAWLNSQGIKGDKTSKGQVFKPKAKMQRYLIAVYMFRITKASHSSSAKSPYADIPTSHYFFHEIDWAQKNGVMVGSKSSKGQVFKPKTDLTRATMGTVLKNADYNLSKY